MILRVLYFSASGKRGIVHSLSSGKVECVEALNRYCGSSSSQGVIHVQALNGNSA